MSTNNTNVNPTVPRATRAKKIADGAKAALAGQQGRDSEPIYLNEGEMRVASQSDEGTVLTLSFEDADMPLGRLPVKEGLKIGVIIDAQGNWFVHSHPEVATLNPCRGGPVTVVQNRTDWDDLGDVGDIEVQTLDEWRQDLKDPEADFFLRQRCFLDDVGLALMQLRQEKGLSRGRMADRAGMNRATVIAIEGAFQDEGNKLSTIAKFLAPLGCALPLTLTPLNQQHPGLTVPAPFASDPAGYAAAMVTRLRRMAGLSQSELWSRMKMSRTVLQGKPLPTPANLPKSAPPISRMENGQNKDGSRMGTLFGIAYACGFMLGVDLKETKES